MSKPTDLGSIKEGSYLIIDGEPCRVVAYDKSKYGKHGSAKARVVGIGLLDGVKRTIVSPVSAHVEVPIIEKKTGQVISATPTTVQLMDLQTYEVVEVGMPTDEETRSKIANGIEVEYWRVLGKNRIMRAKS